jgi:hypothetical protein
MYDEYGASSAMLRNESSRGFQMWTVTYGASTWMVVNRLRR